LQAGAEVVTAPTDPRQRKTDLVAIARELAARGFNEVTVETARSFPARCCRGRDRRDLPLPGAEALRRFGPGLFALPEMVRIEQALMPRIIDVRQWARTCDHREARSLMFTGIVTAVGRIATARPMATACGCGSTRPDSAWTTWPSATRSRSRASATRGGEGARRFEVDTSRATLGCHHRPRRGPRCEPRESRCGCPTGSEATWCRARRRSRDGAAFDDLGGSYALVIEAPGELGRYIARKGAIAWTA
jgi:hypothetical protein